MQHPFTLLPHVLTLALACVAPACVTQDDIDEHDRIAEDVDLDDVDLDDEDDDLDDDVDPRAPDLELAAETPQDAVEGAICHRVDDNGPLPGGHITVTGCDAGESCVLYACAGYSCVGTCHAGGGWTPK
jgi:hypothetical protein